VIDLAAYPAARKRTTGDPNLPQVDNAPIPRTRYFTFLWNETASSRRTVSTPRITGPAIIKEIEFYSGTINATDVKSIEVGYSLVPVTENGVSLATARPYNVLTELIDPFAQRAAGAGVGLSQLSSPNTNVRFTLALDLILDVTEAYVCVALLNTSANAQLWNGRLKVIEGLSRQALSFFL
jgi:hypothetical protein